MRQHIRDYALPVFMIGAFLFLVGQVPWYMARLLFGAIFQ